MNHLGIILLLTHEKNASPLQGYLQEHLVELPSFIHLGLRVQSTETKLLILSFLSLNLCVSSPASIRLSYTRVEAVV